MKQVFPVFKREFQGYFRSPVGYVVLTAFVLLAMILWLFGTKFFKTNTASLEGLFSVMPWMFSVFAPATAMRLWAEEKRSGSVELLLTLPLTTAEAVIGKFIAAWGFVAVGILLTFPAAITVAFLGEPDWGVLVTGYFGTILMAASFLGICSFASALTRNQIIAFLIGLLICVTLTFLGYNWFSDFLGAYAPVWLVDTLANFSFATHFRAITVGLIDLSSLIFFTSVAAVTLIANIIVLER
jgi:ABC-2 type transport system permease protein